MDYAFDRFERQLIKLNIELTNNMKEQFSRYYDLLIEWNKKINLTAITEFEEVIDKHFLDSVALGHYLQMENPWSVMDLGTGAGFPGIPLKIIFPQLKVLLADSLNKRVRFLEEVIAELGLKDIRAVHGRAEELARQSEYRESYDLCVSRAVAHLAVLGEYCLPFVKVKGVFVGYKSVGVKEEIVQAEKAFQIMGGRLRRVEEFQLPETEYGRSFVFVDKVRQTPKKYPRKAGIPSKNPL